MYVITAKLHPQSTKHGLSSFLVRARHKLMFVSILYFIEVLSIHRGVFSAVHYVKSNGKKCIKVKLLIVH